MFYNLFDQVETPIEWVSDEPYPSLLSINISKIIWPGNHIVQRQQFVCVERNINGQCAKTEKRLVYTAPISFKKKTHLKVWFFVFWTKIN